MYKKIALSVILISSLSFAEDFDVSDAKVVNVEKDYKKSVSFLDDKTNVKSIEEDINDNPAPNIGVEPEPINTQDIQNAKIVDSSDTELGETVNISSEPISNIVPVKVNRFVPKRYNGIRYARGYDWFSLIDNRKNYFHDVISNLNLRTPFEKVKNDISNLKNVAANAFYYDYIKNDPTLAENFYLILYKNRHRHKEIDFYVAEVLLTDYLIRTGRPKPAKNVLKPMDCVTNFKQKAICNYYIGVVEYLNSGNNRNTGIRNSKGYIKKAKQIWDKTSKKRKGY